MLTGVALRLLLRVDLEADNVDASLKFVLGRFGRVVVIPSMMMISLVLRDIT